MRVIKRKERETVSEMRNGVGSRSYAPPGNHRYFFSLSSGYSCNICLCIHSHQPNTRTPHSHHAYTNKPTTILRSLDRVFREIIGSNHGPVGDEAHRIPFVAPRERQQNLFRDEPGERRECDCRESNSRRLQAHRLC